jgi:hypothetical protein
MQQTALNLIAIGVFAITLSILLGPLLNISPLVPTLTTLGIMGLAAIDTISWQNQGITLLLDTLSPKQHRQRIVHHEAGHFLVAYFLGFPITGYTLTAWETFKQKRHNSIGGVEVDIQILSAQTFDQREMPLLLERFCSVWMAGIAAETLVYGNVEGGEEDRQKIKKTLMLAGLSETTCQQKERWALLQAKSLLEKHQTAYEALVEAMQKRISVEECYQIIQQHCQPPKHD